MQQEEKKYAKKIAATLLIDKTVCPCSERLSKQCIASVLCGMIFPAFMSHVNESFDVF